MKKEAMIHVGGVVQGVGFRPFVHRIASYYGLTGSVSNLGDVGVRISVEGEKSRIGDFLKDLKDKAPPVAKAEKISVSWGPYKNRFSDFSIVRSSAERVTFGSMLPPDIAVCPDCRDDISKLGSRWSDYPFTVCSSCGPRFTATYKLPYDRSRTNMSDFPLCDECVKEYEDQSNRRFHAQGICCARCGPKMTLFSADGLPVSVRDPIAESMRLLDEGFIVAVKGLGGVHLATKTTEDEPIRKLRQRKKRLHQPLALMSPSVDAVRAFAEVDSPEETLLTSWRRPIVVLRKSPKYYLSNLVSPGLDTVGVMLPYSGIHLIIFKRTQEPALVMTSANRSGIPMAVDNESALRDLKNIADFFLLHNRQIVNRCDDSVLRVLDGKPTLIRRSRGYVPSSISVPLPNPENLAVIAYGAELRSAAAILKIDKCYPTQYIGDCDNLETFDYLESAVKRLAEYLNITSDQVVTACDLHPGYLSSRLARVISQRTSSPLIKIQHHHAHITSLMAENDVREPVVGVAVDGVGYGSDGTIWGGEILEASYKSAKRMGYLEPLPMPGGDLCTQNPARMLVAGLTRSMSDEAISKNVPLKALKHLGSQSLPSVLKASRSPNVTLTSSAGRVLDAVSAALGICYKRTYEGEPAVALESVAAQGRSSRLEVLPRILKKNGSLIFETSALLSDVMAELNKHRRDDLAAAAQRALATGLAKMAVEVANSSGRRIVGISGGVAVNAEIVRQVREIVLNAGLKFIQHTAMPPGDGCISLGQAVTALAQHCDL